MFRHCGNVIEPIIRKLDPTPLECGRGVTKLHVYQFFCHSEGCKVRRILFKQEEFENGIFGVYERVRQHQRASIIRRVRLAPDSDAVQGTVREKFSGKWIFRESISV